MDDPKFRRVMHRAHYMGSNENDILFGGFAEKYLASLSPAQLDKFEALLANNDTDLFNWVTGKEPVPAEWDDEVMTRIKSFVQNEAARR